MNSEKVKYKWMKPFQRELYQDLSREFNFTNLTDVGKFLGLNNPYHGAKLIFEAKKKNLYLKKLVEIRSADRAKIEELEATINQVKQFKSSIESSVTELASSLDSIRQIKSRLG